MKPYILTLQAFGPFETRTTVDFTRFGSSLFLITGRTGSGKSTIFDALMYALFGETSGKERAPKDMRTQNIDAKTKTVISLDFEHNGRRYLIERTISGRKTATEDAMFRHPDGRIVEKTKAVNAEIETLLGIEAEQFRMIAMLPQGRFRELLTAKSDKRSDILKKLFDTRIYALFQDRLKHKDEMLRDEHESFIQDISREIQHLSVPADDPAYAELAAFIREPDVTGSSLESLFADLEKLATDDAAHIGQLNGQLQTVKADLVRVAEEKGKAESGNRLIDQAAAARKNRDQLLSKEQVYRQKETTVKRARAAETVSAAETVYQSLVDRHRKLDTDIENSTKTIETLDPQIRNLADKLENLETDPEIKEKKERRDMLNALLPAYRKLETDEANRTALAQKISESEKTVAAISARIAELTDRIAQLETREKELDVVDVTLAETKNRLEKIREKEKSLETFDTLLADLDRMATTLQLRQQECIRAKDECRMKSRTAETLQMQYLDGQAGILADDLEEGRPCPVCGSLAHPDPARHAESIPERAEVNAAQKAADTARETWTKKSNAAAVAKSERDAKETELRTAAEPFVDTNGSIDEIRDRLAEYKEQLDTETEDLLLESSRLSRLAGEKKTIAETLPQLRAEMTEKITERSGEEQIANTGSGRLNALDQTIAESRRTLPYPTQAAAKTAIDDLERDIDYHEQELKFLREHQQNLRETYSKETGALQRAQADRAAVIPDETEKYAAYQRARETNGFATIEEYRNAIMDAQILADTDKDVRTFFTSLESAKEVCRQSEENCQGCTYTDLGTLTERQNTLYAEETRLQDIRSAYLRRRDENAQIAATISALWTRMQSRIEEYTAVHKLAETANGTVTGQERIDLERYIQAVYFSEILRFANKQLLTMSGSRYELIRPETASTLRGKSGLELAVTDRFTGQTRDITTLSGGESFLAALALALGLSEMIQHLSGGISIDALFVDEGFDTLDTDALQDVLKVLWTLTTGNRVVGIISHRGELRDQLDRKIIVTKLGNGRSRIESNY
ncbi:MAG TPA: SMC family ATPase [Methanocorpusculum sp.]|nr:SMC family ATPase [Methanocorpusculum sp.]